MSIQINLTLLATFFILSTFGLLTARGGYQLKLSTFFSVGLSSVLVLPHPMANRSSNIDRLPTECVSTILSFTSPAEACRFLLVSSNLLSAADSDIVWRSFLPSDYEDILSRAVNPLKFSSQKDLFFALCSPILIDGGKKSFKLDKFSGKKSYILSARELSLTWSNDPMFWSWRQRPESRFSVVAELRTASWLEIEGRIRSGNLTSNTIYGAYLIMKVSHRAYGLDSVASDVSVEVGNRILQRGKAYLSDKKTEKVMEEYERVPKEREDGWMEIELGEFFIGEGDQEEEVRMSLMEVGYRLKGGLIVDGIEIRPKQR